MAIKAAMWVHGIIAEAENPVSFVKRRGWGAQFGGRAQLNWFHIPMTIPAILDGARPQLAKVFVLYKTNKAVVKNVHIFDGPRKIRGFDGLNLSGDHSVTIDAWNNWAITPNMSIQFGLGISLGVEFGTDPGDILFTSAGADLITL